MGDHRIQDVKGKVKEGVGEATGDQELEQKGRSDQAKASVKEAAGDVKNALGDAADKLTGK